MRTWLGRWRRPSQAPPTVLAPAERVSPQRPRPKSTLVIKRSQLYVLIALFVANALLVLGLFVALLGGRGQPAATIIVPATPAITLPTRSPTVMPTASPTPPMPTPIPTPFGGGGAVAFTLRREGNYDVYAVNLGDRRLVRLTWEPSEDRDPAFSPDGRELAFASRRDGNWEIYRMDVASSVVTRLTYTTTYEAAPAWSPDGQWLAVESYRDDNLDIYLIDRDGKQVIQLTDNSAPDFSPAWSPDGRYIAFVSYREGNKDIFLYALDRAGNYGAVNLTHSPDREEDQPTWSHDGARLAYTSGRTGDQVIYINTFDWKTGKVTDSHVELFGQGTAPAFSPDDTSLGFVYNRDDQGYLVAASLYGWGLAQQAFGGREIIHSPTWTHQPIPAGTIERITGQASLKAPPLYLEVINSPITSTPPFTLVTLPDLAQTFLLSDAVDDSFTALRKRVVQESGYDYLAKLASTWRPMNHVPRPGQSRRTWHCAGRAFDIWPEYITNPQYNIEVVREDIGYTVYWRVYMRAAVQDGSLGEPLREAPWDLNARSLGGEASEEGGQPKKIPAGYYIDFTTLAADYGWSRVQAIYRWRWYFPDIEYWHFQKMDGLTWWEAMEQIYLTKDIVASYGPYPGRDN
jgi:TolB protein